VREGAKPARATLDAALERATAILAGRGDKVAVVVSATLDNEALFAARRLVAQALKGARVFVSARADGADQDDILLRNDKNPNRAGVEALFGALPDTAALRAAVASGDVTHVLALGGTFSADDVQGATVIAASVHATEAVRAAEVVLPLQSHAEHDGSFTNFAGQVQRFQAGIAPVGEAVAGWELLSRLGRALGADLQLSSAGGALKALAKEQPEFTGFTHISLGTTGRKLGSGLTVEAPAEPTATAP
jgi:NADH-quinone oxidoreductase subunit G